MFSRFGFVDMEFPEDPILFQEPTLCSYDFDQMQVKTFSGSESF